LLGVTPASNRDEIKRAFRREISRYHPDKVQHLGPEFQEIAATRASELTAAYRVLMDEAARLAYDEQLEEGVGPGPPVTPPAPGAPQARAPQPPVGTEPGRSSPSAAVSERSVSARDRDDTTEFVRKAVLARVREAVAEVVDEALSGGASGGIDAAYEIRGRTGLFRRADPPLRLLVRYVPQVDAQAVEQAWGIAIKAGPEPKTCLLLMGSGLAPAPELAAAVAEQRRRTRLMGPLIVPVDVRDWGALFPPEAPASIRAIVKRLAERHA
jgi:hypothetical protein